MTFKDHVRVYRAVRRQRLGWWTALRCCNDVRRRSWSPRTNGELAAQLDLVGQALRDR